VRGDIRDLATVERAAGRATTIFHQAAMRSVPALGRRPARRQRPQRQRHAQRAGGGAARRRQRVVYASSSSVYGDRPELPQARGPAAGADLALCGLQGDGEQYAAVWHRLYGVETVGLRYFNVFGPRQDPKSEYAVVIPRFIMWALPARRSRSTAMAPVARLHLHRQRGGSQLPGRRGAGRPGRSSTWAAATR
jgi:UDP-glucose 4-epimerase